MCSAPLSKSEIPNPSSSISLPGSEQIKSCKRRRFRYQDPSPLGNVSSIKGREVKEPGKLFFAISPKKKSARVRFTATAASQISRPRGIKKFSLGNRLRCSAPYLGKKGDFSLFVVIQLAAYHSQLLPYSKLTISLFFLFAGSDGSPEKCTEFQFPCKNGKCIRPP